MIHRYPARVLVTLIVLAGGFFALGAPGYGDTSGPWMYISGLSFIAFLLTTTTLLVLAAYLGVARLRARRSEPEQ